MPLDRDTAAVRIVREMKESEQAIADALVATTSLFHSAAIAHRDVGGVPAPKSFAAFKRLQNMTGSLIDTQSEAARVHSILLDIGIETGAFDEPTCPDQKSASRDMTIAA